MIILLTFKLRLNTSELKQFNFVDRSDLYFQTIIQFINKQIMNINNNTNNNNNIKNIHSMYDVDVDVVDDVDDLFVDELNDGLKMG